MFFKYKTNTLEDIKCISNLLNIETLDMDLKRRIIVNGQVIKDLNSITEKVLTEENEERRITLWGLYLEENKVKPTYSNIILITFINDNSENLNIDVILPNENFIKSIIKNDKINDKCFSNIVNLASVKCIFNEFDFSNINKARSKQILSNSKIEIKFNQNNYENIKEYHQELFENNIKAFCLL